MMAIPIRRLGNRHTVSRLALIARAATSHGAAPEREWAAGLRWQPEHTVPAHVFVERRFRPDRQEAVAAYVAGGRTDTNRATGFVLEGYGQAGFVTGKSGGAFADVQLHTHKPLVSGNDVKLSAGASIWGGGQDRLMRLDLGPSVRAVLPAGGAQIRVDASWRFRIAGNAQPGNGPAITLSTSF